MSNSQADRLAEQIKRTLTGIPRAAELKDALNAVDAIAALAKQQASPEAKCRGDTGECLHNGACMYACGLAAPPSAPQCEQAALPAVSLHLTAGQLRDAVEFVVGDDPETEIVLTKREAFTCTEGDEMPAGIYAHLGDYPEEGVYGPLDNGPSIAQSTPPAAGVGEQATGGDARRVIEQAEAALSRCYDVESYPGDGETSQDRALAACRAWLAEAGIKEKT